MLVSAAVRGSAGAACGAKIGRHMTATSAARLPADGPPALHRNLSLMALLGGQFVSRAGDALLSLASVWLVLDMTGNNPLASSAALVFEILPYILFGLVAGVLVDRWDRRRTMVVADSLRGLILVAVPVLYAAGVLQVWHIFAVNFALSSLGRLFTPAKQALLPEMVEPAQIVRANSLAEGSGQAAFILGPAVGGILVGLIGPANVFYFDAVSFFVSAASLAFVRARRTAGGGAPQGSLWQQTMGGVRHIRRTPVLVRAIPLSTAGNLTFAAVPALLPVLVRDVLAAGSDTYGVLMALFFAGSVAGSAVTGKSGERLHRGWALLTGIAAVGAGTLALGAAPTVTVAGMVLFLLGAAASAFNVALYSLLQQETPPDLRGRVFAAMQMASQCLRPAALMAAGLIAYRTNTRLGLEVLAVAALAAGLAGAFTRTLRETR
jgi:MFS family permease